MTLVQLRKIASDLKIAGRSKMGKTDLARAVDAEMASLYSEAMTEDKARTAPVKTGRKSYTERMLNRVQGYYTQNGCARLTPKQSRRHDKKYRKQYGNLLAKLV